MSRPTSPRAFSADQLRTALGDAGGPARPDYLADIVAQAGRSRQRPAWALLGRWLPSDHAVRHRGVPRAGVVLASVLLLVALLAAGLALVGSQRQQPDRLSGLPATPADWQRVVIETPSVTGRVASLAVSPRGLLAAVGGDEPARLAFSSDGRTWTLVPEDKLPRLSNDWGFGMPTLLGTDRGFLMLQLNEVWSSENGSDWRRLISFDESTDPDLRTGGPDIAITGGPGLVGVGGDGAWYSVDGSDWSLATVPPLPAEMPEARGNDRSIRMAGVTASGRGLVAWGLAEAPVTDNPDENLVVPLLWTSNDGRTWVDAVDPAMDSVASVTAGPHGFVATGQSGGAAAVWFSADGYAWERVGREVLANPARLQLDAAASTPAGYVIAATEGECEWYPCPDQGVVTWISADGRSWSPVPSDDRFTGSQAYAAVAWGSTFVITGSSDGKPAVWISGSER